MITETTQKIREQLDAMRKKLAYGIGPDGALMVIAE